MRVGALLLFCLACLAFTAQAAPASAKDELLAQKLRQRDGGDKKNSSNGEHGRHHQEARQPKKHRRSEGVVDRLHARELTPGEAQKVGDTVSKLVPQEDLLNDLQTKVTGIENARREAERQKQHTMQVEDSIHMAKYGKAPPKFPSITRAASAIGLSAAVLNVVNFIFSTKTTLQATYQFSAPPTPPTLIDTAARWDGSQYTLMSLPTDKPDESQSHKSKRQVEKAQLTRLQKRHLSNGAVAESDVQRRFVRSRQLPPADPSGQLKESVQKLKLSKRQYISSVVGAGLGALLSPGFTSTVMGKKKEDMDTPPFNPYDRNILKPKDAFSAAAATPGQTLPVLASSNPDYSSALSTPPNVDGIKFPVDVYDTEGASQSQAQNLVYPLSSQSQSVLRKREVNGDRDRIDARASSQLDKRFLFTGGPWSKLAGAITVGSVVPLIYGGVTHARWRQYNPRDRDILKDIDDRPTYGAVGVPDRQPGQLATNAMPGYSNYVTQLQQEQALQQARAQTAAREQGQASSPDELSQSSTSAASGVTAPDGAASGQSGVPVLKRRAADSLEKRGGLLASGALVVVGGLLGYAQSATQFPTDRDEEKDEKKREAKKKQQELMAQQQQQQQATQMQGGAGALAADPTGGASGGSQTDPLAGIPVKPLPGSDVSAAYDSSGGGYLAASGDGGASGFSPPTYGSGGASSGGISSLGDSLNAAAGYQAPASGGGGGGGSGGSVLKKRDASADGNTAHTASDHQVESRSLSKRTPGFGTALTIGGTAMFVGTLAGNIFVGEKQKNKPVPLVTPNANTRGPMIPGGELYTSYLEAQRGQTGTGAGSYSPMSGVGTGLATGAPASINYGAAAMSSAGGGMPSSAGVSTLSTSGDGTPGDTSAGTANGDTSGLAGAADPVLKKRSMLRKRVPLGFAGAAVAAETEAVALTRAGAGAASVLGRGAAVSGAEAGTAALARGATVSGADVGTASLARGAGLSESGTARAAFAGRGGGLGGEAASLSRGEAGLASEGGAGMLGRGTWMGRGGSAASLYRTDAAMGSARPAMVSDMPAVTPGTAGSPATIQGAMSAEAGAGKEAAKGGMSFKKVAAIVGGGAAATMTFNGIG